MKISVEKLALDVLVQHLSNTKNPFLTWAEITRKMYSNLTGLPFRAAIVQTRQRKFKIKELASENGYTLICDWNSENSRIRGLKLAKIEDAQLIKREMSIMEKNWKSRELSINRYFDSAKRLIELQAKQQQLELQMT